MIWNSSKNKKMKSLKPQPLSFNDSFHIDMSDMDLSDSIESLPGLSGTKKLFLGRFNSDNLYAMMDKIGLIKHLQSIGFDELLVDIDVDQNRISYMRLYWREKTPSKQLIDLRVSESSFIPDKKFFKKNAVITPYSMIVIEWLSAKNPLKDFNDEKPQLPGQTNPGLGVLKYCFEMLYIMAKEVFKDGFLDIPDHMHGAIMYSKKFKFFDPAHEGIIRAVGRDLRKYSLSDISWGVLTGTIIDLSTNKPAIYDPGEQIHYVSKRMKKYFESKMYRTVLMKYYEKKRYFFDYDEMVRKREEILRSNKIEDL
ncbi:MAG: hypothetical protein CVV49_03110 [Spirochaetae bacterium HGW-Spirochaetae-5]|nr:MAG: hypothetical protein CVV49_03110 [Spirochaetae bacterium HGW-Spirochaetae-5]